MKNKITFKDVETRHFNEIYSLINMMWKWEDSLSNKKNFYSALNLYLDDILYNSSYGKVAILNGEVIGVVFGRLNNASPHYRMLIHNPIVDTLNLLSTCPSEQKIITKRYQLFQKSYASLLYGKESDYDGSINLLAVSKKVQGLGIGRQLWNQINSYFKKNNAQKIYLFTDTDCNYHFYDHLSLRYADSQAYSLKLPNSIWDVRIFLYDYLIKYED